MLSQCTWIIIALAFALVASANWVLYALDQDLIAKLDHIKLGGAKKPVYIVVGVIGAIGAVLAIMHMLKMRKTQ